jgi:RNA polymerase subunit RPABC4/transcription elongation factor Spt4
MIGPGSMMIDSLIKEPPVVPFVECPNCKQLMEFGAEMCPRCREEISPEYAVVSASVVYHNTQACSLANTIISFNAFMPIALIVSVGIYVIDWYGSGTPRLAFGLLFYSLIPLLVIVLWYIRFGRFLVGDEEYLRARRELRQSFALWCVLLVVQLLMLAVAITRISRN